MWLVPVFRASTGFRSRRGRRPPHPPRRRRQRGAVRRTRVRRSRLSCRECRFWRTAEAIRGVAMARREPRSLHGKVVAITGGARGIGKATARSLVREGATVAIGDLDVDLAQATAKELGSGTIALELNVTDRELLRRLPGPGRGAARPARRDRQQRGDHADRPVRRRDRRHRPADDRHQPARRHLRDEAGAARDDPQGKRAHRQHRLAGGQGRIPGRGHLLRDQARRRRPQRGRSRRGSQHRRRDLLRDAGDRQHRADGRG